MYTEKQLQEMSISELELIAGKILNKEFSHEGITRNLENLHKVLVIEFILIKQTT